MDDFRAWNVDQYDEDALTLAELEPQDARSEHDLLQLAQAKQSRARAALARYAARPLTQRRHARRAG